MFGYSTKVVICKSFPTSVVPFYYSRHNNAKITLKSDNSKYLLVILFTFVSILHFLYSLIRHSLSARRLSYSEHSIVISYKNP